MAEYQIGIENWKPIRQKPVLTVIKDNEHIKVASFNNQESADLFYNVFCTNYVKSTDKAIQTIRELQEDCNRYHEWGMHEGYEEAKEKYKCKYWNTEHKECSHGNTIVIEEVCEWKLFDEETNAYNTTCGGAFWFNDGSTKDNGFKYCPYCGRKLRWWSND